MKILFKKILLHLFVRLFNVFSNKSEITMEKLSDSFMIFTATRYLSVLGGIFGLLELLNISNVFNLFVFPLLIIIISLIAFVYSTNKTEGVSVTISTSRVITEVYNTHNDLVQLIELITETEVHDDQDGDSGKEKYFN